MYVALLGIGSVLSIFGLLQAAYPPFQRWWYETRWANPHSKERFNIKSAEYSTAIFHMKMAGGRAALVGILLSLFALSQLGLV